MYAFKDDLCHEDKIGVFFLEKCTHVMFKVYTDGQNSHWQTCVNENLIIDNNNIDILNIFLKYK